MGLFILYIKIKKCSKYAARYFNEKIIIFFDLITNNNKTKNKKQKTKNKKQKTKTKNKKRYFEFGENVSQQSGGISLARTHIKQNYVFCEFFYCHFTTCRGSEGGGGGSGGSGESGGSGRSGGSGGSGGRSGNGSGGSGSGGKRGIRGSIGRGRIAREIIEPLYDLLHSN
jgi:hypothetical protein